MENALGMIPLVFILLFKLIDRRFKIKVNLPSTVLRFYLGVEILLAIGLLDIVGSLNNDIRALGFEGNKKYFSIAYFSLLPVYPLIKYSSLFDVEKWGAKILTAIPVVISIFAFIPWVGLPIWSFFIRLTGSDREIVFETERFRIEQVEYVPMSGGHYEFYLIGKDNASCKEFILGEMYRRPNYYDGINDVFPLKGGQIYFSKVNEKGHLDTLGLKGNMKKLKMLKNK